VIIGVFSFFFTSAPEPSRPCAWPGVCFVGVVPNMFGGWMMEYVLWVHVVCCV
jgi:hypothetical protein